MTSPTDDENLVLIALAIVFALIACVAFSVRAQTQTGVLIGAILWLLFDVVLGLAAVLAATPCGLISGRGLLTPTGSCPVQATHIVSAILGGGAFLAVLVASGGGFAYVQTGRLTARQVFRFALLLALALILLWVLADGMLPRKAPSD